MQTIMKYIKLQYWKKLRVSHSEATDFVFQSLAKRTEKWPNYYDLTSCSKFWAQVSSFSILVRRGHCQFCWLLSHLS